MNESALVADIMHLIENAFGDLTEDQQRRVLAIARSLKRLVQPTEK